MGRDPETREFPTFEALVPVPAGHLRCCASVVTWCMIIMVMKLAAAGLGAAAAVAEAYRKVTLPLRIADAAHGRALCEFEKFHFREGK